MVKKVSTTGERRLQLKHGHLKCASPR
jgi:hypothetical protein